MLYLYNSQSFNSKDLKEDSQNTFVNKWPDSSYFTKVYYYFGTLFFNQLHVVSFRDL